MSSRVMVIVPALNEEACIGDVVRSARAAFECATVVVIDDCSSDRTVIAAEKAGAEVLRLPVHLGLGGCVQTGYRFAFEMGYDFVIRVDGDGQHSACDIPRIYETLRTTGAEVVIGSRFLGVAQKHTTVPRRIGIVFFRMILRIILGKPIRDPTSGLIGVNRAALEVFARSFPLAYPEIEALVVLQRNRFRFQEIPCVMRPRQGGKSSITPLMSMHYMFRVLLGVLVNILKK